MLYCLAFFEGNATAMKQQVDWATGQPGREDMMFSTVSDTEAWFGRLNNARKVSQQAIDSALRIQEKERAAFWQGKAAIREALFGNAAAARRNAATAASLASGSRDAQAQVALAYALAGDLSNATSLADDLAKRFPENTILHSFWLSTIRAQIELVRKNPARSIEILQAAPPYDMGNGFGPTKGTSCITEIQSGTIAYISSIGINRERSKSTPKTPTSSTFWKGPRPLSPEEPWQVGRRRLLPRSEEPRLTGAWSA